MESKGYIKRDFRREEVDKEPIQVFVSLDWKQISFILKKIKHKPEAVNKYFT